MIVCMAGRWEDGTVGVCVVVWGCGDGRVQVVGCVGRDDGTGMDEGREGGAREGGLTCGAHVTWQGITSGRRAGRRAGRALT